MQRIDALVSVARMMAARGQRPWSIGDPLNGVARPADVDWPYGIGAYMPLDAILDYEGPPLIIRPSGLVQELPDVILTWSTNRLNQFLIGTARAMLDFCHRVRAEPHSCLVVPDSICHGTCVRVEDIRGWRFVQAYWVR